MKFGSNNKLGLESTMNGQNSKKQSTIASCEQETTSEKAIIFQKPFSPSAYSYSKNISRRKTTRFLFQRVQNHYSDWISIIMEMRQKTFKRQLSIQSNSLSCKKTLEGKMKV